MPEACKSHYSQLYTAAGQVLEETFSEQHAEGMAKSHAFVADLALWIDVLAQRPEATVLRAGLREYEFALLALGFGQYRAAFSSLRLSLELAFSAVQWSANERDLREWKIGQRDVNWAALCDAENGILSRQFVRLFTEALADLAPQYRAAAQAVYRECSEYVHGNAQTHQTLPPKLGFDAGAFESWQTKASTVRLTISFALAARYLSDLSRAQKASLESVLLDHLGHCEGVRAILGSPAENRSA